ncbi:metal ABC transporter permease [Desulfosporosinus sp. PR]|uniref:metal ABC transporter permease n=1 Tax=Candidatus Desulfosporosinus nitrosoreducens TaxID=3401928 RepID=UPI0027E608D8|nr:metal ABC transporter permease [Desulfosporosinus sp. PR]MDQ7093773.1 metal ABC transporter permease [Desulfosporosinus sp. PR]
MFHYDFMQHAFLAGTLVALMCGCIGVFVIARGLPFIAHTFSHIGFSGAAFALYMGVDPLNGMLLFTCASALVIGRLGIKMFRKDAVISVILSIFLGLGLLFLTLSSKQSNAISSLLFGTVLGISPEDVMKLAVLSTFVLFVLVLGYKMLTFDSFDPIGAQAAGLPIRFISVAFLLLLSVATAEAVQVIGALLVFTLMTTPAATAQRLTHSISRMIWLSALISVLGVWIGLVLGFYTNAPVSFFISAVEGIFYFASLGWSMFRERRVSEKRAVSLDSGV